MPQGRENVVFGVGWTVLADKVKLVDIKGVTSIYIDAEITDNGDLLISGQDIGTAPRKVRHDDDYEYWLTVRAPNKDRFLLALLDKLYADNPSLVS